MNRIKELRKQKHLTLKQLGSELNMLDSTLSQYENQKRKPKDEIWEKIAKYFGVTVPYLQGKTLDKTQIINRVVNNVHVCYFQCYVKRYRNKQQQKGFFYGWVADYHLPEFMDNMNTYISITSDDVLPPKLYSNNEIRFELNDKVLDYWEKHIELVAQQMEKANIPTKTDSYELFIIFNQYLKQVRNKLVHDVKPTNLGKLFAKKYDKEKYLHDEMIEKISFGNYQSAKKAIKEYSNFIDELLEEVDKLK